MKLPRNKVSLNQLRPGDLFWRVDNVSGACEHFAIKLESTEQDTLKTSNIPEEEKWVLTTWNLKAKRFNYLRYWYEQNASIDYFLIQKPDGS